MGCTNSKSSAVEAPSLRNGATAQKVIRTASSGVSASDADTFDKNEKISRFADPIPEDGQEGADGKEEEGEAEDPSLLAYLGQMSNSFSVKEPVSSITAGVNVDNSPNKKPQRRVSGISTEVISRIAEGGNQRRLSSEARRNSSIMTAPNPEMMSPEQRRMSSIHQKRSSVGALESTPENSTPVLRSGLSKLWGPVEKPEESESPQEKGFASVLNESNAAAETAPKKKNGLSKLWGDAEVLVDDAPEGSAVASVMKPLAVSPVDPAVPVPEAPVAEIPEGLDAFVDENGKVVYCDKDGNIVDPEQPNGHNDSPAVAEVALDLPEGVNAFVDEKGNLVYCDAAGNVVDPSQPSAAVASEPNSELQAFQDENGNIVYCDADGNVVRPPEVEMEAQTESTAPEVQAFQDEAGNIVYLDAAGNTVDAPTGPSSVAEPTSELQAFQDEHGNVVYCDMEGNIVPQPETAPEESSAATPLETTDQSKLQAFQDENGNVVYCDARGNVVEQTTPPPVEASELQAFQDEHGNVVYCDAAGNIVSRAEEAPVVEPVVADIPAHIQEETTAASSELQAFQDEDGNIVYCDSSGSVVEQPSVAAAAEGVPMSEGTEQDATLTAASLEEPHEAEVAQEEEGGIVLADVLVTESQADSVVPDNGEVAAAVEPEVVVERQYTQVQAFNDAAGNIVFCDPDGNVIPQNFSLSNGSVLQAYLGEGGAIVYCNENSEIVPDAVDLYREMAIEAAAMTRVEVPAKKKSGNSKLHIVKRFLLFIIGYNCTSLFV